MLTGCMGCGNVAGQIQRDDRQEEELLCLVQEWRKSNHFQQFLRQELARARTETEKEVVRAELAVVGRRLAILKGRLNEIACLEGGTEDDGPQGRTFALTLQ